MHAHAAAALLLVMGMGEVRLQDPPADPVQGLVTKYFRGASPELQDSLRTGLLQELNRSDLRPEARAAAEKGLDLIFGYSCALLSPVTRKGTSAPDAPVAPQELSNRGYQLASDYLLQYVRAGLNRPQPDAELKALVLRQVDQLIQDAHGIIRGGLTGVYADSLAFEVLQRHRIKINESITSDFSPSAARLLTTEEYEGLLADVRSGVAGLSEPIRADMPPTLDEEGRKDRKKLQETVLMLSKAGKLAQPMFRVVDCWNPELARRFAELKAFSAEGEAWMKGAYAKVNAERKKAREAAVKVKPGEARRAPANTFALGARDPGRESACCSNRGEGHQHDSAGSTNGVYVALSGLVLLTILVAWGLRRASPVREAARPVKS